MSYDSRWKEGGIVMSDIAKEISKLIEDGEKLQNQINKNHTHLIALTNLLIKNEHITKDDLDKDIEELSE